MAGGNTHRLLIFLLFVSYTPRYQLQQSSERPEHLTSTTTEGVKPSEENSAACTTPAATSNENVEDNEVDVSPGFIDLARRHPAYKAAMAIQSYYYPFITTMGLAGNSLSLAAMLRRRNRRISCCVYMAALAVADNMLLLAIGGYWVLTEVTSTHLSRPECQAIGFFVQFGQVTGAWIIIMMTLDKTIAIKMPLRAVSLCTTRRARWTCAVIFMAAAPLCGSYGLRTGPAPGGRICTGNTVSDATSVAFTWTKMALNGVIPIVALLTMNSLIIHAIRQRPAGQPGRADDNSAASKQPDAPDANRQLTLMLFGVTFAYIFLMGQLYARQITYIFISTVTFDPAGYAHYLLVMHLAQKLAATNNAVNFLLYCLSGTRFRADVKVILSFRQMPEVTKMDLKYPARAPNTDDTLGDK